MLCIIRDNFIQNLYKVYVNQIKYQNIKILTTTNKKCAGGPDIASCQINTGRLVTSGEGGQWSFDWSFLESAACLLPSYSLTNDGWEREEAGGDKSE